MVVSSGGSAGLQPMRCWTLAPSASSSSSSKPDLARAGLVGRHRRHVNEPHPVRVEKSRAPSALHSVCSAQQPSNRRRGWAPWGQWSAGSPRRPRPGPTGAATSPHHRSAGRQSCRSRRRPTRRLPRRPPREWARMECAWLDCPAGMGAALEGSPSTAPRVSPVVRSAPRLKTSEWRGWIGAGAVACASTASTRAGTSDPRARRRARRARAGCGRAAPGCRVS